MDFLRDVKAKLEELEEFSKQAQEMMQDPSQKQLFQPKSQPQQGARGKSQGAAQRVQRQASEFQSAVEPRRSRQPVDSQECPVEEWSEQHRPSASSGSGGESIFDDLNERLDEAYLLQEILGPPRCMRGWD